MMMKNILREYNAVAFLPDEDINIISLSDTKELTISLYNNSNGKTIKITFESPVAYRSIDSGFLDKIWGSLSKELEGKVVYEYENSTFVDYIKEMSLGIYDDWEIRHFAIYGGEVAVDVLSVKEPKVFVQ